MKTYRIFKAAIADDLSLNRHERETMAVNGLIKEAFGDAVSDDLKVGHDPNGAPHIEGRPDIHISISHSIDTCVLAVSDEPIGIDIETARQQLRRVAAKFLTPEEHTRYSDITDEDSGMAFLLKAWTAKEAVFKAALIPDLVLSDISLASDLNQAESRNRKFTIHYPQASTDEVIAVAMEA